MGYNAVSQGGSDFPYRYKKIKLTPTQRQEIRDRRVEGGECPKALALEYGVSASYVRQLAPLG